MIRTGNPKYSRAKLAAAALVAAALVTAVAPRPVPAATSRPFHGFCHCSGTFIPDCNTSADCQGGRCLSAPTFC